MLPVDIHIFIFVCGSIFLWDYLLEVVTACPMARQGFSSGCVHTRTRAPGSMFPNNRSLAPAHKHVHSREKPWCGC